MFSQRYGKHPAAFGEDIFALLIRYAYFCGIRIINIFVFLSESESVPVFILDER